MGELRGANYGIFGMTDIPCPDCGTVLAEYKGHGGNPPHDFFFVACGQCMTVHGIRFPDEEYDL